MAVNPGRAGTVLADRRRPYRERLAAFTLLLVSVLAVASVVQPIPAGAVTGDAQQLLSLINEERAAVGAQPLTFRDDLVQIAAQHSAWMASTGNFQHRSDLSEGVTGPSTRIGENIAYGWSVSTIHRMFMESKGHCENNLYSGFNRVGIEFATGGNGAMYVTVVFVQESGGSLPKPTVCPYDYSTTTTTAPPATTTTTTAPPATTTTVPPAMTTTTAPPATTTTVPPATTTTTVPPATTTTTAPPVTTTTTAPPASTRTTDPVAEAVLPLTAITTTTTRPVLASGGSLSAGPAGDSALAAIDRPLGGATNSNDAEDASGSFPVLPVSGAIAALAVTGVWWFVEAKRAAAHMAAASPRWEIPHGGVRPAE